MRWISWEGLKPFAERVKNIISRIAYPVVAWGKVSTSGGQTEFGVISSINYACHTVLPPGGSSYANASPLALTCAAIALVANVELTAVTRIPSLKYRILGNPYGDTKLVDRFSRIDFQSDDRGTYLVAAIGSGVTGLASCVFSTVNSWFFGRNLTEFGSALAGIEANDPDWKGTINGIAIGMSFWSLISAGTSNATYNFYTKALGNGKLAAKKYLRGDHKWANLDSRTRRNVVKTVSFSVFNLASSATFAYYSTKKSFPRLMDDWFSWDVPDGSKNFVAGFSTMFTLSTNLLTTTPAVYKWFSRVPNPEDHYLDKSPTARMVRRSTLYFFGVIDSGSTGLGNFRGSADLCQDAFNIAHYSGWSIMIGVVCAATGAFSNYVFNVVEGFEDYNSARIRQEDARRTRIEAEDDRPLGLTLNQNPSLEMMVVNGENGSFYVPINAVMEVSPEPSPPELQSSEDECKASPTEFLPPPPRLYSPGSNRALMFQPPPIAIRAELPQTVALEMTERLLPEHRPSTP